MCEIANRKTPSLILHWVGVAGLESVTKVGSSTGSRTTEELGLESQIE